MKKSIKQTKWLLLALFCLVGIAANVLAEQGPANPAFLVNQSNSISTNLISYLKSSKHQSTNSSQSNFWRINSTATELTSSVLPLAANLAVSSTDFYIADYSGNRIAVYDQNLVFKHYLDTGFNFVTGLDFLPNGHLIAAGRIPGRVKIYNPSGTVSADFTNVKVGDPIDAKASSSNLIYIGTTGGRIAEFSTSGTYNRDLITSGDEGIAILPGNILWAGGSRYGNKIDIFNLDTGNKTTLTLDNGQTIAESMYYSPLTNTVLMTTQYSNKIFERTTTGAFVRQFDIPSGSSGSQYGVTRGPNGNVYATDYWSRKVYYWQANGTYIGTTDISANVTGPVNIVWVGNSANANTAPVADADLYTTNEDTPLIVNEAAGVLMNDNDPDGNPLKAILVSPPANAASFTLNQNGSFSYMPNADFNGTDSFTYKANDEQADSNVVTVTITVNPVNDAPVINCPAPPTPATYTPPSGTSVPVSFVVSDWEKDALTVTWKVDGTVVQTDNIAAGTVLNTITLNRNYNAGTYSVEATVTDGIITTPVTSCPISVIVNKANQTITSFTPIGGKTYGDATFTLNATASSGLPVSFQIVSGNATISGNMLTITGAGNITVKAMQTGNSNYNAAPEVQQTFTVAKATPVVGWSNPANITYGTALSNTQLNATASFKSSPLPGSFAYTPAPGTVLNAGNNQTLSVVFTPTDTANFNNASASVLITVNKAPLTVTADNKSKTQGQPNPPFTVSYSGFVNGDQPSSLGGTLNFSTPATISSAAGYYPITPSGLTSANYNITFQNGTLTIVATPTIAKGFAPTLIQPGGTSTVTLYLGNTVNNFAVTNASFGDTLINMSAVGGAVGGTCAGTTPNVLPAGATDLNFSGITIPALGNCTVTYQVTSNKTGTHPNAVTGVLTNQTTVAGTVSNTANLTVTAPPQITKSFSPSSIEVGGVSTLSFTITNPSINVVALKAVGVEDVFPAGIVMDTAPNTTNSCTNGTFAAAAGDNRLFISAVTIPINSTCTFTVQVKGTSAGAFVNTTGNVTSSNGGHGNAASATLRVGVRTNVALAANGGVATASSHIAGGAPYLANDGIRNWAQSGTWKDATPNVYPDVLQVDFSGSKTIQEIDVFAVRDDYTNPTDPGEDETFSLYGITSFDVEYWDGANWTAVPNGNVSNTNKVVTKLVFPEITTTKIRVVVNNAQANYSRIVEVEAWVAIGSGTTPTPTPTPVTTPTPSSTPTPTPTPSSTPTPTPTPGIRTNVALATNGGTASASTGGGAANLAIDGINNWATSGAWKDTTANVYPDWLQVDFSGSKTINEIDVVAVKDNYFDPSDPTEGETFSVYGITKFDVQYWSGSAWVTVPGGVVVNNNKVITKLVFAPVTTTKIRVVVKAAQASYSRIVELQAWSG